MYFLIYHLKKISVGPGSVEYKLTKEAIVFGGSTLVTTDIAVAAGYAELGDCKLVSHLPSEFVTQTMALIQEYVEDAVDSVKVFFHSMHIPGTHITPFQRLYNVHLTSRWRRCNVKTTLCEY